MRFNPARSVQSVIMSDIDTTTHRKVKAQLTVEEKETIVEMLRSGRSVVSIAREYDRARQTIYDLRDKDIYTGSVERKVKLDEETRERILEMTREEPTISSARLRTKIGADVSVSTIRRVVMTATID